MLTLLWVLSGLVALVLLVFIGVIALPVHLRLRAEVGEAAEGGPRPSGRFSAEVRLFGGLAPPLRISNEARSGPREPPAEPETEDKARPGKKRGRKPRRMPGGRGAARRMIAALPDLIGGELRRIHIDRLAVNADFGLADPADTGRVYGYLTPVIYATHSPRLALDLRPDFTRARLSGQAEAALHLTPGALAWPAIRFAWAVFVARR